MTRLWLIGGSVFLGILLIASLVLALTQKENLLPLGTAEAAVQNFLIASEAEDFQVAYDFLSEELKADCKLEDFAGQHRFDGGQVEDSSVTLDKTSTADGVTFVDVRITQFYGTSPFGSSESTQQQRYSLRQEDGLWKFSVYPWPYYNCGQDRFAPPYYEVPALRPTPAATPAPLMAPTAEPPAKPAAP
ncbi:MAG: hypothetical protein O2821_06775 [Chloroflexi bacterium]|nr:hypothetical protein [Chloroflexota bacterium]MDA1228965.1 hypothetical protein [Chloroflexota bacterium]